jgi:hypothetical protein
MKKRYVWKVLERGYGSRLWECVDYGITTSVSTLADKVYEESRKLGLSDIDLCRGTFRGAGGEEHSTEEDFVVNRGNAAVVFGTAGGKELKSSDLITVTQRLGNSPLYMKNPTDYDALDTVCSAFELLGLTDRYGKSFTSRSIAVDKGGILSFEAHYAYKKGNLDEIRSMFPADKKLQSIAKALQEVQSKQAYCLTANIKETKHVTRLEGLLTRIYADPGRSDLSMYDSWYDRAWEDAADVLTLLFSELAIWASRELSNNTGDTK